jgi:two-component sensor histidine kinase
LQTSEDDPALRQRLQEASSRIAAIARAHDRLYRSTQVEKIELGEYLALVCGDLSEATPNCDVACNAPDKLLMSTDRAIRVALLVTELVSNAAKHAYPDGKQGRIQVSVTRGDGETACICVRDEGVGLPPAFDLESRGRGLGMRLAKALAQQSEARITVKRLANGTEFVIVLALVGT